MGSWTSSNPCPRCGAKFGAMVRCENCGTLGCPKCVGTPGKSTCKVCKKITKKVKV